MFRNTMPRYEILSEEAIETLDRGWRRIVSEIGVEFILPEAVEIFRAAGCRTEDATVFLDPDFVMEQVARVPREFDLVARNPEKSVRIGGDNMVFTGVYGPPFVREGDERRDEPGDRALGQVGGLGQLADPDRRGAVRDRDEQLGGAVDRLGPGGVRH